MMEPRDPEHFVEKKISLAKTFGSNQWRLATRGESSYGRSSNLSMCKTIGIKSFVSHR